MLNLILQQKVSLISLLCSNLEQLKLEYNNCLSLSKLTEYSNDYNNIVKLAECYIHGNGISKDLVESFRLLKTIEGKHPKGTFLLASAYYFGKGTIKDYQLAFDLFCKASDLGSYEAFTYKGICYSYGHGVAKDPVKAFESYKSAAEKSSLGRHLLGVSYLSGEGIAKDEKIALKHIKIAGSGGFMLSLFTLGTIYLNGTNGVTKDIPRAVDYFDKASNLGHLLSTNQLASIYFASKSPKAIAYLDKSIKANSHEGMCMKGICLYEGICTTLDYSGAFALFKSAHSIKPTANSCYYLGLCYSTGNGVTKDNILAITYLQSAYKAGHHFSFVQLGKVYLELYEHKNAFDSFENASKSGIPEGTYELAKCYNDGIGVISDCSKALELLESIKSSYTFAESLISQIQAK